MIGDAFPKLPIFRPSKLAEAVEKLDGKPGEILGGFNGALWATLLEKVRDGVSLTETEKVKLMGNVDRIPSELHTSFFELFSQGLDAQTLARCSRFPGKTLSPMSAVKMLSHSSIEAAHGRLHLPPGFFEFREELGMDSPSALVAKATKDRIAAPDLIDSFGHEKGQQVLSTAQVRVAKDLINFRDSDYLMDSGHKQLIDLLRRVVLTPQNWEDSLDNLVGAYMTLDQAWENKVLDLEYPLGSIVKQLLGLNESIEVIIRNRGSLAALVKRLRFLENVLERLNQVEPDRGVFWGNFLKYANQVIALRVTADSNVETAVAFYFRELVVVEFAPKGNAAYIYDKATFEGQLRPGQSWKRLELARDRWFHRGGWQYSFKRELQKIVGGSL